MLLFPAQHSHNTMAANGVKAGSKRKTAPASKGASDSKSKKTKFEKKAAPVETPEDDEMEDAAESSDSDDGGVKLNPRERAKQAQANGNKEGANFDKSKQFEKGRPHKSGPLRLRLVLTNITQDKLRRSPMPSRRNSPSSARLRSPWPMKYNEPRRFGSD